MVDSGAFGELAFQNMLYWGVHPRHVRALINTHAHVDRSGGDWIFHGYGITIAAGRRDGIAIQRAEEKYMASDLIGVKPRGVPVGWFIDEDTEICDGVVTIMTPGHTKSSVAVVVENEIVLAGDVFGPLSKNWESDEREWLMSLERLKELEPRTLCTNNTCIYGIRKVIESIDYVISQGPVWIS